MVRILSERAGRHTLRLLLRAPAPPPPPAPPGPAPGASAAALPAAQAAAPSAGRSPSPGPNPILGSEAAAAASPAAEVLHEAAVAVEEAAVSSNHSYAHGFWPPQGAVAGVPAGFAVQVWFLSSQAGRGACVHPAEPLAMTCSGRVVSAIYSPLSNTLYSSLAARANKKICRSKSACCPTSKGQSGKLAGARQACDAFGNPRRAGGDAFQARVRGGTPATRAWRTAATAATPSRAPCRPRATTRSP